MVYEVAETSEHYFDLVTCDVMKMFPAKRLWAGSDAILYARMCK